MSKTITRIVFKNEAREQVMQGVRLTAEAVAVTLGPLGHIVLIAKEDSAPVTTKDGVSVAKSINLRDPVQRMGSELIKEAASQTNDLAGDGTTTTVVLTHAMLEEGLRYLTSFPAIKLIEGVKIASDQIMQNVSAAAIKLTDRETLQQIATISANNDDVIGSLIADAFDRVGRSGIITVEDAKGTTTSLEIVEGLQFERGYLSPYFVNNSDKMHVQYSDALVLITDRKISMAKDLIPALEAAGQTGKPLLIIADDVVDEALQTLVLNRTKGNLKVCAVKAPGYGDHKIELLHDMAILTGATLISAASGHSLDKASVKQLGKVKKIVVDRGFTTLVADGTTAEQVQIRLTELASQLDDITITPETSTKLQVRMAKLSGGVAVIKVGGATEMEMVERKYRIEDALHATRAAIDEGVLPGGGVALVRAAKNVPSSDDRGIQAGIDIVVKACSAPLRRIVTNANGQPDVIMNELFHSDRRLGFNALTGKFVDMIEAGVIDPAKVCRLAVKHAASVTCTFLNLDAVVVEEST